MSPTSFLTLERGTPVVDRFGRHVGEVGRCLLLEGGGFDGLVVRTKAGDRDAVVEVLKRAYIEDELVTTDDLAERVGIAHTAGTLEQLESALAGLDRP